MSLGLLRDSTNQYVNPPAYLAGVPPLTTKQIPINNTVGTSTDTSEVYTADWTQLMLGMRTDLRIAFLRERYIDNGQYAFLAWMRCDVQLAQPARVRGRHRGPGLIVTLFTKSFAATLGLTGTTPASRWAAGHGGFSMLAAIWREQQQREAEALLNPGSDRPTCEPIAREGVDVNLWRSLR